VRRAESAAEWRREIPDARAATIRGAAPQRSGAATISGRRRRHGPRETCVIRSVPAWRRCRAGLASSGRFRMAPTPRRSCVVRRVPHGADVAPILRGLEAEHKFSALFLPVMQQDRFQRAALRDARHKEIP